MRRVASEHPHPTMLRTVSDLVRVHMDAAVALRSMAMVPAPPTTTDHH